MAKYNPTTVSGGFSQTKINENFDDISDAIEKTLSRDGTGPNQMEADLDMDGNAILNVGSITIPGDITVGGDLTVGGTLDMSGNEITNMAPATGGGSATTLTQVKEEATKVVHDILGSTTTTINELTIVSVASMKLLNLTIGQVVTTTGYYSPGDGGGASYKIVAGATGTDDGGEFHDLANGNQAKLLINNTVNVLQYGANADGTTDDLSYFNAAGATGYPIFVPGNKNYRLSAAATGDFFSDGVINFTDNGDTFIRSVLYTLGSDGPRSIIQYRTADTINLRDVQYPMAGFRFHGRYKKFNVPVFTSATQQTSVSISSDLAFGMTSPALDNWYAIFAVANNGDANCTFEAVPYLRAHSVSTNTITLNVAGEGVYAPDPQTYSWAADALNGTDLLVITETLSSRNNVFSGRVTSIIDSAADAITVEDIGTIGALDWLLPAPVGYDHYRYCGSAFFEKHPTLEIGELRNIADSGTVVRSRGTIDASGTNTGSVPSLQIRRPDGGHISPLATGLVMQSRGALSTASTGDLNEVFSMDTSNHDEHVFIYRKDGTAPTGYITGDIHIAFSFGPQYYYRNSGSLASSRSNGQQQYWGWIEP